jgi:hypothetical protein
VNGKIWAFKLSNLYIAQTKADFIVDGGDRSVNIPTQDANICILSVEIGVQCDRDPIYP